MLHKNIKIGHFPFRPSEFKATTWSPQVHMYQTVETVNGLYAAVDLLLTTIFAHRDLGENPGLPLTVWEKIFSFLDWGETNAFEVRPASSCFYEWYTDEAGMHIDLQHDSAEMQVHKKTRIEGTFPMNKDEQEKYENYAPYHICDDHLVPLTRPLYCEMVLRGVRNRQLDRAAEKKDTKDEKIYLIPREFPLPGEDTFDGKSAAYLRNK
jgi:hypothetical protein